MGMTCSLWRVTVSDVERLAAAGPNQIQEFLFGEATPTAQQGKRAGLIGWLKNLSPIQIETGGELSQPIDGKGTQARAELDLDKAWHGLHYLFTSTAWEGNEPACFLLKGGDDLGEDEIGNSIPRVLRPVHVRQFAAFLSELSQDELTRRYNPEQMMKLEIFPEVWNRGDEEDLEHLLDAFDDLREFMRTAANAADAIVLLVN